MLILLYYLSQNPDFPESVKPLMSQLKNSEQMLCFLNDLSKFTQTFSTLKNQNCSTPPPPPKEETKKEPPKEKPIEKNAEKKEPQSPTAGIADDFIQQILEGYLNKH